MKVNRTKIVTSYSMITSVDLSLQNIFVYYLCDLAVAFAAAFLCEKEVHTFRKISNLEMTENGEKSNEQYNHKTGKKRRL